MVVSLVDDPTTMPGSSIELPACCPPATTATPTTREDSVSRSSAPTTAEVGVSPDVFRATRPIPRGTDGDVALTSYLEQVRVPVWYRPDEAIAHGSEVTKKAALFEVPAGAIIIAGMFVDDPDSVPGWPDVRSPATPVKQPAPILDDFGSQQVFVVVTEVPRGTPASVAIADGSIMPRYAGPPAVPAQVVTASYIIDGGLALYDLPKNTIIVLCMFV
jgi:hypothetical protein